MHTGMPGRQDHTHRVQPAPLQVFASLLKVPAPVSSAQWASTPTKYGPAGSPLRGAGLGGAGLGGCAGAGGELGALSGGLAGGAGSPGGAYGASGGGGGGSPLLSSRYASLAAGL